MYIEALLAHMQNTQSLASPSRSSDLHHLTQTPHMTLDNRRQRSTLEAMISSHHGVIPQQAAKADRVETFLV